MGLDYLWDTNSVIYYLQEQFDPHASNIVDNILVHHIPSISVITEMEVLSWRFATEKDLILMSNFISDCLTYQLDELVKLQTIDIRKTYKIKLPDAIIASTALVHDKTLITRNTTDFKRIDGMKLLNPFERDPIL